MGRRGGGAKGMLVPLQNYWGGGGGGGGWPPSSSAYGDHILAIVFSS